MTVTYANGDEVRLYSGDPQSTWDPTHHELSRASRLVDEATLLAIYDVDEEGAPQELAIAQAFRDAVSAQCLYWRATGDDGRTKRYSQHKMLSTAFQTEHQDEGTGGRTLCAEAVQILRDAGLLNQAGRRIRVLP